MIERQFSHLPVGSIREPCFAKTERCAEKPAESFEISVALGIVDVDTFAALDHHRSDFAMKTEIGVRVKVVIDVVLFQVLHGLVP